MRGTGEHIPPPIDEMQKGPEDNTLEHVMQQVQVHLRHGLLIHTEIAREIASWYQSPTINGMSFAEFASRGFISPSLLESIRRELYNWLYEPNLLSNYPEVLDAIKTLSVLEDYVQKCLQAQN